jgi:hypothetical protein
VSQVAALAGGQVTKIAFYPSSGGVADYKIRVWQGPDAATLLIDQVVPSVYLDNWNILSVINPVPVDITKELWIGVNVNASSGWPAGCDAGPAVLGHGDMIKYNGSWSTLMELAGWDYNWNIQGYVESLKDKTDKRNVIPFIQNLNYNNRGTFSSSGLPSLNTKKFNPSEDAAFDGRALMGYNIYRSDDFRVTYNKLNTSILTNMTYVDAVTHDQEYWYYVTSIFPTYGSLTCESDSSNVKPANVKTGIDQLNSGKISIYPNPANDLVKIESTSKIKSIEVMNFIGQPVYTNPAVNNTTMQINTSNLSKGIYFVKIATDEGIRTLKITIAN